MINKESCGLVFVDVQGELANKVHQSQQLLTNLKFLIQSCEILSIPIIWLEQYPKGLGTTVSELAEILVNNDKANSVLEKTHFNAMLETDVKKAITQAGCQQWLIVGIEAHICVYQTAMGLLNENYSVNLLVDAISSLRIEDKQLAIKRLSQEGVNLSNVEMAIFELLKNAKCDEFKAVLSLVKARQSALLISDNN